MQRATGPASAVGISLFDVLLPGFLPHPADPLRGLLHRHLGGLVGQVEHKDFLLIGGHDNSMVNSLNLRKGPLRAILPNVCYNEHIFIKTAPEMPDAELVFKIKADFLKSMAHPVRLAIIEHLKDKEASVGQMAGALGVEQSSLSKHLALLRQAGIVTSRQEKVTVYYSIRDRDIFQMLRPIAEMLRKKLRESQKVLAQLGRA